MIKWLQNKNLQNLMKVLNPCMAVGGCVRDHLMNVDFQNEIDLATSLLPETVIDLAKKAGFKVIPTGLQHGTVTCVMGKDVFEVTTLRVDVETDGRHASVEFSESWEEDAKRRDLTINSLYVDMHGKVYDFVGGMEDIKSGCIKFIGDPELRIQEDYLRILRFFRFFARYGKEYDQKSLLACGKYVRFLTQIARERCINEILKLLESDNYIKVLKMMDDINIWEYCDFPKPDFNALEKLSKREACLGKASAIARLSVFKGDVLNMKLSNLQKRNIEILRKAEMSSESKHIKWINESPDYLWDDGMILKSSFVDFSFLDIWKKKLFQFSGNKIMTIMNIKPGPKVKYYLDELKSWYVNQKLPPSESEIISYLKSIK